MKDLIKNMVGWLLVWLFFFSVSVNQGDDDNSWLIATFLTSLELVVYYTNLKFLLPRFYILNKKKKYYGYAITMWLTLLFFFLILDSLYIEDSFKKHECHDPDEFEFIEYFFFSIMIGLAFFISSTIGLQKHEGKLKVQVQKLRREKTATELMFLKSQINPHFLFNALNNIYSLSYSGNKKATDQILSLSDMLRYVLYDCKEDSVPIKKELSYIEHFITFQKLKTNHDQNINYTLKAENVSISIAPMILIPFIENSFKHSLIEKDRDGFVTIKIEINNKVIHFSIENSKPSFNRAMLLNDEGGIGLDNVIKRLNLIYEDGYDLEIVDNETYKVNLKIITS